MDTLPKTNIAPENGWLEVEISYWEGLFSGDMLVSGRGDPYQKDRELHPMKYMKYWNIYTQINIRGISQKGARSYFINSLNRIKSFSLKAAQLGLYYTKNICETDFHRLLSLILFVECVLCWMNICFLNQHTPHESGMSEGFTGQSWDVGFSCNISG